MKDKSNHNITIHAKNAIVGNNNHMLNVKSETEVLNDRIFNLSIEVERLKSDLSWAIDQLRLKDLIIKQIL